MTHESFKREERVQGSSNRSFGYVFAAAFSVIGLLPLLFGSGVRLWSIVVAIVFALLGTFSPSTLTPLNRLWTRVGMILHAVVSPVALGIMFFLVVTPTGLLMRALGKDPLKLRFDRAAKSYWAERTPPGPKPESLIDQF